MTTKHRWAAHGALAAVLVGVVVSATATRSTAQDTGGDDQPFSGSSSAVGVRVTTIIPGFIATQMPVDSGGPTAQAAAESLGLSTGYAALPDPGQFVTTLPGLGSGLLGGGAAGLPPIPLPTPPDYPFFVTSDVNGTPEASVGSGPYSLRASSKDGYSEASAVGGFSSGLTGAISLVTSTASVGRTESGVVSTATSLMQGLQIGPLTIGEIKSTATETMEADGTVTPSTDLSISAVRIAGLPVTLSDDELHLLGPTAALPINPTLASILAGAGVTMTVVKEQVFDDRVVAPAIQITMPFTIPDVSTGPGTATITMGSATAALAGPVAFDEGSAAMPPSNSSEPPTPDPLLGVGSSGLGALPPLTATPGVEATPSLGGTAPELVGETHPVGLFDIRSLYLAAVLAAIAVALMGQLIRLLGVRRPWI